MKKNNTIWVLSFFVFFVVFQASAQDLGSKIATSNNYFEICEIAEAHYAQVRNTGVKPKGDIKEKHFRRWEWYMKNRLGPHGEIINANKLNQQAYHQTKKSSASDVRSTYSDWYFIGPSEIPNISSSTSFIGNGRLDKIAFHPTKENVIYVGSPAGGLWRTIDNGLTWESLDNYLPTVGVSGIAIGNSNSNIIYVADGTGIGNGSYSNESNGVYKSTDGGNNWQFFSISDQLQYFGATDLLIHPNDDNVIFVASKSGLFRSKNGGYTWDEIYPSTVHDLEFSLDTPYRLYFSGNSSVGYIEDSEGNASLTFSDFDTPPKAGNKILATTIADKENVYLISVDEVELDAVFKSNNRGDDFNTIMSDTNIVKDQGYVHLVIDVSPTNENIVMAGGVKLYKSTDGGVNYDENMPYDIPSGMNIYSYVHPDFHDLKYSPLNGDLYAATDGGLYRSVNDGLNWINITNGIHTTQFFTIASSPQNPNKVVGGTQDNGGKFKNGTSNIWDHYGNGDSYITAYHPKDEDIHYIGSHSFMEKWEHGIATTITPPGNFLKTHMQISSHDTNGDILYVGTRADTFCISTDQGNSWSNQVLKSDICIETCPNNPTWIYTAGGLNKRNTNGGIEINKSTNSGSTWNRVDVNNGLPNWSASGLFPSDLSVRPNNSNFVLLSISGYIDGEKVYSTINGGTTWTNITGQLPNVPVHCVANLNNGGMLAGTELGVFYKANSSKEWIPFNNGLPWAHISEMIVHEAQQLVTVATYGRGAWRSALPNGKCDENFTFTSSDNLVGRQYFEANNTIELQGAITNPGTQLYFQAGNKIDLTEGFRGVSNSLGQIRAYIGPCGSQIPDGD